MNVSKWQYLWRPLVLIVVIILISILARLFGLGSRIGEIRNWIDSIGAWGPLIYVLLYILATIAVIPGAVMTVIGGAIFGSFFGIILVSVGATLGASLAFLIARYFARDSVIKWLSGNAKFNRLDEITQKHGAIIVAIVRLIPLFPFNIANYGFGLTRISFWNYVFWSWLCMLPGIIIYVAGADAFTTGIITGRIPSSIILLVFSLVIFLTILVRYLKKLLKEKNIDIGNSGKKMNQS